MVRILRGLAHKYFSDEEAVILFLLLVAGTFFIIWFGAMLAPAIASLIIAFILQGLVVKLNRLGVPETVSILGVFLLFLGALVGVIFGLLPLIWTQVSRLAGEAPRIIRETQSYLELLPDQYPQLISAEAIDTMYQQVSTEVGQLTQWLVSFSLSSIPDLVALLIYMVLVPILVFFFLKDKEELLGSIARLLPPQRPLMLKIWHEVNLQCANYVRGKALEIVIVGGATYIAFKLLGMPYAALLSLLVGLSVVIPYIGAAVVTIPVAMIALFAFGWGSHFIWVMVVYGIIQALDGNVLVPILFSEVNNLHPVAIIVAVLFFGGIWGLWGVFFAIPLATLLKAVFAAWPVKEVPPPPAGELG
ncbi:AI-2E family transporter [Marinobacter lutaoensis]|jgi:putative permease|uniref:AI-2E family transporter n=1 Tax=Marinobacter lutaoensis TaxID=135739 RepID=A0A1V2DY23_9GAMM|nr:AI-2E family transporter [Marinobacter lutaoensis]MBI42521.1 AI-2E family transporter [Oceanospirillales bacterium]NVD36709.1 AI-2E family transporter [Marinobacter lutaoensis]ONF45399.1 AI-2E family transporter [Marinobacter lutaoensis]|tara:strand:- start:3390 stop:4469 length:1080 start_codon:yes stop_codon:yes gene_type:complete